MEVIHRRCSGLDVHKQTVVACVRLVLDDKITREVRTFETTTSGLLLLLAWLTWVAPMRPWKQPAFTGSRFGTF